jgi:FkbM family methyltransferase
MSLLERIFEHPALRDDPPVLVDVGASGGVHAPWRRIARFAIGVGFEPDARETAALAPAQRQFRRWILVPKLVTSDPGTPDVEFHLTTSPFCSSTLRPDESALGAWAFSDRFTVKESHRLPACTLAAAMQTHGLARIDWLKCDTQGTDLRIFQSLAPEIRQQVLAVELEPGLIDAYHGEDKFHHVLAAMEREPFWLSRLAVLGAPRGRTTMLTTRLGGALAHRYRYLGPIAPGWVEALYLHSCDDDSGIDLRAHLLLWVFASENAQPSFACEVAETGLRRFGDALFAELADASTRAMRRALWRTWPRWPGLLWSKLVR